MSMLRAQVDKLRKAAQTYRYLGNYDTEQMLLDAADTIWELRGSVHRERAEADKLRELVRDMWRDGMCECDERGVCAECEYRFPDRMRELGVEVE